MFAAIIESCSVANSSLIYHPKKRRNSSWVYFQVSLVLRNGSPTNKIENCLVCVLKIIKRMRYFGVMFKRTPHKYVK